MKKKINSQIRRDFQDVSNKLVALAHGESKNYIVGDPDYLHPTLRLTSVSLANPEGLFCYYSKIHRILNRGLTVGSIKQEDLTEIRAPEYLWGLVEQERYSGTHMISRK